MFDNTNINAANPYELFASSWAIDRAVSAEPAPGSIDLDGTPRVIGPLADLGCQEFRGSAVHEWCLF
jgi:hypothetical protein